MNRQQLTIATLLIAGLTIILSWNAIWHREEIDHDQSNDSEEGQLAFQLSQKSTNAHLKKSIFKSFSTIPPSSQIVRETNHYTVIHSNIFINTVTVDGPMEYLIGTDQYELLAKNDYDSNVVFETHLRKIRDSIEAERPGSGRLYSAVRIVYETRADVMDMRHKLFDLEFTSSARIGRIQGNSSLSDEEKKNQIQTEINDINAQRMAYDLEAKNDYDRFLRHMKTLVGELSEATLERFYAFEPRFSPQRFRTEP